jgi:hypothetical protein
VVQGRVIGKDKEELIWSMYFVYQHENRTMKPVEIVLRRGKAEEEVWLEGVNLINIHYKHICKYSNEIPL